MFDKIYSFSCLEEFEGFHEHTACPREGTLSGYAIKKVEYFDLESNRDMDGFLGIVLSRILSVAIPVIALLDALHAPCKAIYFAASKEPRAAVRQLSEMISLLTLSVFSLLSLPLAMYQPTRVFRSRSTWDEIKQKHMRETLNEALVQIRKQNPSVNDDAELLSMAISQTLPKVFKTANCEETIEPIVKAIAEQLERPPDESTILMEHFTQWVSLFVISCHQEKLPIEVIDQNFFDLIIETVKLKNPQLRGDLTHRIIRDFAKRAPVVSSFKEQLQAFEEKRQENIQSYIEDRKKTKGLEKQRLEERIRRTETQFAKIENIEKNRKKREGIQKRLDSLRKELPNAGMIDDRFLLEITNKANEIHPPFTSGHHVYLPLYFSLVHISYTKELFQLLSARVFKDCHQSRFLLNFLLLLNDHSTLVSPSAMIDGLQKARKLDEEEKDRNFSNSIQYLKNSTILLQLKEWEKLRQGLIDENKPLHSTAIIPELFKERFNFESINRYKGAEGNKTFLKDYETSFARFRDPTTVMVLYSTFSLLKSDEQKAAFEGLARYVTYTLNSPEELHKKRHDPDLSPHLKECYKKRPDIKPLWENCELSPLTEDDPKYTGYTIGEASAPGDLAMCSQEVIKSCLHPSGRPHKVKGFLGVLLDGKIHPAVIKNSNEKIVARMLLKLMLTEDEESLCLIMDTVYTSSQHSEETRFFEEKILEYSLQRAKELNVPLVSAHKSDSETKQMISPVVSKKSPAPYEHVNAFEGLQLTNKIIFENGDYSIPEVYLVS